MITDADAASCDADECCETLHLLQTWKTLQTNMHRRSVMMSALIMQI